MPSIEPIVLGVCLQTGAGEPMVLSLIAIVGLEGEEALSRRAGVPKQSQRR